MSGPIPPFATCPSLSFLVLVCLVFLVDQRREDVVLRSCACWVQVRLASVLKDFFLSDGSD